MQLRPFRAYTPSPEQASSVVSLPYDVMTEDEARARAQTSPLNIAAVIRPETQWAAGQSPGQAEMFAAAATRWRELVAKKALTQRSTPGYWVYRLTRGAHVQTGIVGLVNTEEYRSEVIKKHELTRPDKENERTSHMDHTDAQFGLVYLTHRPNPEIDQLAERGAAGPPHLEFELGGANHALWEVDGADEVEQIAAAFGRVEGAYIADGHHRAAASNRVQALRAARQGGVSGEESFNYFVACTFPSDQLLVLPYNRAVRDLAGRTPEEFLDALGEQFLVRPATVVVPREPQRFCLYLDKRWWEIEPLPGTFPAFDPIRSLDVSILQDLVLGPLLGIEDPRTDPRIEFLGGNRTPEHLERMVDRGHAAVAFSLHATRVDDVMRVADAAGIMPPKSTWFEPKLASGLLVHALDGQGPTP